MSDRTLIYLTVIDARAYLFRILSTDRVFWFESFSCSFNWVWEWSRRTLGFVSSSCSYDKVRVWVKKKGKLLTKQQNKQKVCDPKPKYLTSDGYLSLIYIYSCCLYLVISTTTTTKDKNNIMWHLSQHSRNKYMEKGPVMLWSSDLFQIYTSYV